MMQLHDLHNNLIIAIINKFSNSLWQLIVDVTINERSNIVQPLKNAYPYTSFFNMIFNHDESQVDYLGYKELFIMNDGQTQTNANRHSHITTTVNSVFSFNQEILITIFYSLFQHLLVIYLILIFM